MPQYFAAKIFFISGFNMPGFKMELWTVRWFLMVSQYLFYLFSLPFSYPADCSGRH